MFRKEDIDWQVRPSVLQYFGTYLTVLVVIYLIYQAQFLLSPYPWRTFYYYTNWRYLYSDWSMLSWQKLALAGSYLAMLLAGIYLVSKVLTSLFTRYILMKDQLIIHRFYLLGSIQSRVELYRIVDYTMAQTFWGGLFNYYTILLKTTDASVSQVRLGGLRRGIEVMNHLRDEVERVRMKKGVREFTSGVPGWH